MRDYGHPFTPIRFRIGQLQAVAPDHPLLRFGPYVLGVGTWTPEHWHDYHAMFNQSRRQTMPEMDAVYCNALSAAIHTKGGP